MKGTKDERQHVSTLAAYIFLLWSDLFIPSLMCLIFQKLHRGPV